MAKNSFDELIIHVLQDDHTPEERAEYDRLFETDPNFVRKVEAIKNWLDPLSESEHVVVPDESLLDDILSKIDEADGIDGDIN